MLSVQFSCCIMSDSLWPHGPQHTRPLCPLATPRVYPNPRPLSWWYHPIVFILGRPLLLPPSIFPTFRAFSNDSVLRIRWPKHWSFSPSNEHAGLISFRMDWLDLLQTRSSQHHSSKSSILWCSAFFIVQLSHPYITAGKTIALIRWTFVGKVMSLLFNILLLLSRFSRVWLCVTP